jgi:hypothetical protein
VHAKFGEGFFFLRLTRISRGKAGKYARGIILEKSKKNRRRIVEIFGECRPQVHQKVYDLRKVCISCAAMHLIITECRLLIQNARNNYDMHVIITAVKL